MGRRDCDNLDNRFIVGPEVELYSSSHVKRRGLIIGSDADLVIHIYTPNWANIRR
jgi:hypothetical protein